MINKKQLAFLLILNCLLSAVNGLSQINPIFGNFAAAETDVHYQDMHVAVDPAINKVTGVITYFFSAEVDLLNRFVVDYQDDLVVHYIRRGNTDLSFTRSDNLITIDLNKNLGVGEQDTVTIAFESDGTLRQDTHDGAPVISTDLELDMLWYPGKRDLVDKIDSVDLYVSTPPGQLVASNGTLEGIDELADKWVHHWRHRHPVATTYLLQFAVSNYTLVTDSILLQNGTMLPLYHYLFPEALATAIPEVDATGEIMQFFESRFGDYPFSDEKYGHVQTTTSGALEVQTMSFMGFLDFGVIAHEMAHSWFGNNVTFGSWSDIWLSEGMAEYLEGLAVEALRPADWNGLKTSKISSIISQPGGAVHVIDTNNLSAVFSSRLTYNKGFYVAHMLRWVVGDSLFFQACRQFLEEHHDGFARTRDFKEELESVSGRDLDDFFNDWYYGEGYPSYTITWEQVQDSVILWIDQAQSHPSVSFFEMPVPIAAFRFGIVADTVFDHTYNHQRFSMYVGSNNITQLLLDQEKWILSGNNKVMKVITATHDVTPEPELVIYPNPASSCIELSHVGDAEEIEFYNAMGMRVVRRIGDGCVSIVDLPPGTYTLILRGPEGRITGSSSLVVQR